MLGKLEWESLETRRTKYRATLLGKIGEDFFLEKEKHILRLPSYYG